MNVRWLSDELVSAVNLVQHYDEDHFKNIILTQNAGKDIIKSFNNVMREYV